MKGNLIELAVAFVMGAAFAVVVNSLVENLVMPVIAMIFGEPDFSSSTSRSTVRCSATARSSPT